MNEMDLLGIDAETVHKAKIHCDNIKEIKLHTKGNNFV